MAKNSLLKKILISAVCTICGVSGFTSSSYADYTLTKLLLDGLERSKVTERDINRGADGLSLQYIGDLVRSIRERLEKLETINKDEYDNLILLLMNLTKWTINNTNYGMTFDSGFMRYVDDSSGKAREVLFSLQGLAREFSKKFGGEICQETLERDEGIMLEYETFLEDLDADAKKNGFISDMKPRDMSKDNEILDDMIKRLEKRKNRK